MKNREKNRTIAEQTLLEMEQGFYLNQEGQKVNFEEQLENAIDNTILYMPKELDRLVQQEKNQSPRFEDTQYEVIASTTMDAVRKLYEEGESSIFCLNFASAKNPGGGFLGGSQAQEESIARASGLYPTLQKCEAYYLDHRAMRSCTYSDRMIYSPDVPIFKDEQGNPLDDIVPFTVLTSPAVNTGVVRQRESQSVIDSIPDIMRTRMRKVLAIASAHKHDTLVLGAWGCGVFRNDPDEVAQWWKEVLGEDFPNHFKRVVFAIYARNERFITPFQEIWG